MRHLACSLPTGVLLLAVTACAGATGYTQEQTPVGEGRSVQEESSAQASDERSVLDGVYTTQQAASGRTVLQGVCLACHSESQFRNIMELWAGRTVYDLFEQIRTTMPYDGPGRLSRQEYTDLMAYIIRLNGYPAGAEVLPSDEEGLKQIRIEEKAD